MDLRPRILNRPQITSEGYAPYIGAVEAAFGFDVDFAQLAKKYVGIRRFRMLRIVIRPVTSLASIKW